MVTTLSDIKLKVLSEHILDISVYDSMSEYIPGIYSQQSIYPAYTEVHAS